MNLGELKNEIMNLAFEEEETIEEMVDVVITGINRAISIITSIVKPIVSIKDIEHTKSKANYVRYDMIELTKTEEGKRLFGGFIEIARTKDDTYEPKTRCLTEFDRYLLIPGSEEGLYTVYYKTLPTVYNVESNDALEVEVDPSFQILIPLLAAYYIWIDDDKSKAEMYRNDYEQLKTELLNSERKDRIVFRRSFEIGG